MHVQFDDSKASHQIGVDTIDPKISNRLVFCHRLTVEGRYIDHISVFLYQVDIRVLIDGNESLGLFAPGYKGDVSIVETIRLVVSVDALIIQVILIEII